jgi:hypothetical protein
MPFLFTNAALLAGLATLGIPILLHLLLKRKNERLRFSTVRFFQQQDTRSRSKKKLRNLLLLAMRLIVFTLIALAFARPYLPAGLGGRSEPRKQVVLVLDRSLSLQAKDGGGVRWAAALKAAGNLLSRLDQDDRAAVILSGARASLLAPLAPAPVTLKKLENLEPSSGPSDLAEGLREALRIIALSEKGYSNSVAIVSDLQRASCQNLFSAPIPADLDVRILNVGEYAAPNIAVVDLNFAAAETNKPFVTLAHYGDENYPALDNELRIDGKTVFSKPIGFAPGATTNIELELPKVDAGWHSAEFRIRPRDSLAADDVRYGAFYVPPALHVLIVEGKKGVRSYQEESFFVTAALDPNWGAATNGGARYAIERCAPSALAARLRQGLASQPKDISTRPVNGKSTGSSTLDPEVVIIPSARQLDAGAAAALQDYAQAGGGVLMFLGDGLSPSRFNTDLSALLPAQLVRAEKADADYFWRVGQFDRNAPSLSVFQLPSSGNLGLTLFGHRYTLQLAPNSYVEAQFDDGVPLLCSRTLGRGHVLLANTSADTTWSDWPKHKTFVPWLHSAATALANRAHESWIQAGETLVADTDEEIQTGVANFKQPLTLRGPKQQEVTVTPNDRGILEVHLAEPGLYSVLDDAGRELRRMAVNVPAAESDLASWKPADVQRQLVREPIKSSDNLTAGLFGGDNRRKEYWRLLLLAALALMFVETAFSNRSAQ